MLVDLVVPDVTSSSGGVGAVVSGMVQSLQDNEAVNPRVLSMLSNTEPTLANICQSTSAVRHGADFGFFNLRTAMQNRRPDLVHSHGLWHPFCHWAAALCRAKGITLIVQPHGMLDPWCLEHKPIRKKIALRCYQHADLLSAGAFIATSEMEAQNFRTFGCKQPIAVIPNGIALPSAQIARRVDSVTPRATRTAMFLGRLHPVKGLENLIRAWAVVQPPGWKLHIAGPDESGYLPTLQELIRNLGLEESAVYVGPLNHEQKRDAFLASDLFLLPSFSENFGLVVAEALSYGVPVITTTATPWSDLEKYKCGWWIDCSASALASTLRYVTSLDGKLLKAMGASGRQYSERYAWNRIAEKYISTYEWLLQKADRPPFIIL